MKQKYVVYDGVDNCLSLFDIKEKAEQYLQKLFDRYFKYGEWLDGVENCFMSEIKRDVKCIQHGNLHPDNDRSFEMKIVDLLGEENGRAMES